MASSGEERFRIAQDDICAYLDSRSQSVFTQRELSQILEHQREFWRLGSTFSVGRFISQLQKKQLLHAVKLAFPHRPESRYIWRKASIYEVASSLKERAYISHLTAMAFHDLTEQLPRTIYVNVEQPPPPKRSRELTQGGVDIAFARPVRISKNTAQYDSSTICLLNGMGQEELGVIEEADEYGRSIRVSNIERTLLDATVRPVYAGGPNLVLLAYERARKRCSVNKLRAMLKKMDYIYPYHQAIGFYLDKAGYSDKQLVLMDDIPKQVDFYLAHKMGKTEYSERWRLYFPAGM